LYGANLLVVRLQSEIGITMIFEAIRLSMVAAFFWDQWAFVERGKPTSCNALTFGLPNGLNIFLDPYSFLLELVWLGLEGAAVATTFCRSCGVVIIVTFI